MFRKFCKTPLAWLQVRREKTRLAVALAEIAFADVLMFVQLGLNDALYDSAANFHNTLRGDLFIINPQSESGGAGRYTSGIFNSSRKSPPSTLSRVGDGWSNDENILNRIKLYCLTGWRMVEELPILVSGRDFI
jgi:hypothetical protein